MRNTPRILIFVSFLVSLNHVFAQTRAEIIEDMYRSMTPSEREMCFSIDTRIYSEKIAKVYFNNYSNNSGYDLKLRFFERVSDTGLFIKDNAGSPLRKSSEELAYRFAYSWNDGDYLVLGIIIVNQFTARAKFYEERVSDNIASQRKSSNEIRITAQNIKDVIEITTALVELFKAIEK